MTVLIPEAAEAAGSAAGRKTAAKKAAGTRAKTRTPKPEKSPAQVASERAARRERNAQIRAAERSTPEGPAVHAEREQAQREQRRRQVTDRAQATGRSAASSIGGARITPGGRNYQGAILAEFLVAVLVVAFLPLASGRPNDDKTGPSPYRVTDMTQLVAIGAAYFILALFSGGERSGRIVAWFGGLLLLGILFAKVGSGQLSAAVSSVSGVDKASLDNT